MVNGLYTASRGMTNILAKQDVLANNLANANTTGFKISQLATRSDVSIGRNDQRQLHQSEKQTLNEQYTQFSQGSLVSTEHSLDIALSGEGFLNVQTPEGTAYTRNGSLTINTDKQLVTLNGRKVLDDGGQPISIEGNTVAIQSDGSIFVDGHQVSRLGISEFADKKQLLARGDGAYRNMDPAANPPKKAVETEVRQGFLEASNVDTVGAMIAMIAISRNYEADQRVIHSIDQTLGQAVNDVGRVS
jgi:flagellar basal-body rod protein FlgF